MHDEVKKSVNLTASIHHEWGVQLPELSGVSLVRDFEQFTRFVQLMCKWMNCEASLGELELKTLHEYAVRIHPYPFLSGGGKHYSSIPDHLVTAIHHKLSTNLNELNERYILHDYRDFKLFVEDLYRGYVGYKRDSLNEYEVRMLHESVVSLYASGFSKHAGIHCLSYPLHVYTYDNGCAVTVWRDDDLYQVYEASPIDSADKEQSVYFLRQGRGSIKVWYGNLPLPSQVELWWETVTALMNGSNAY
ncbi:hypothetical protein H0A66_10465 [Alcaligenaceae bacterium]|nr:hypothetical protein [Alcaligenaceae bacterium]